MTNFIAHEMIKIILKIVTNILSNQYCEYCKEYTH